MVALCLFGLVASTQVGTHQIERRIVGVDDGDTITLLDVDNLQHKIRLDGIDAPESGQPFGRASKQHFAELLAGRVAHAQDSDVRHPPLKAHHQEARLRGSEIGRTYRCGIEPARRIDLSNIAMPPKQVSFGPAFSYFFHTANKNATRKWRKLLISLVGGAGFEPATPAV